VTGSYTALPAAPNPGETFTVPIPGGPTEQQATDAAVSYGWLIAIVLVGAAVLAAVRYVTKRIDFKLLAVLAAIGVVAYYAGKG
jgi:hypothetical protein